MRYLISNEIWTVWIPMVERCRSKLGPEPELPDRMFFEAVLYWARTGIPLTRHPRRVRGLGCGL